MTIKFPLDCRAYADGGLIGVNPSDKGGTWAVRIVDAAGETLLHAASGIIRPKNYPDEADTHPRVSVRSITNNISELVAVLAALKLMPDGWHGTLYSDSHCTLCRLVNRNPSFAGVPVELYEKTSRARQRFPGLKTVLLNGHPNEEELASGIGSRGLPTDKWNVACDQECNRLAGRKVRPPAKPRKKKILPPS
jgi:ribonuclease HI